MNHVDYMRALPPSESVHRALLELDDPSDDWPVFVWNDRACTLAETTTFDYLECYADDVIEWSWDAGWLHYRLLIAVPL